MLRTFSRDDYERSLREWDQGKFSDEWKPWRHQAAMRGIIFPPEGTRFDSWDDDLPSQRAILIRAIRDTPTLLKAAINRSRSWYEVVEYLMRNLNEWREELDAKDRDLERRKAEIQGEPKQATMALKAIMSRIGDS